MRPPVADECLSPRRSCEPDAPRPDAPGAGRRTPGRAPRTRSGYLESAELALLTTICLIGLLLGMLSIRDVILTELKEMGRALRRVEQPQPADR